MIWRNPVTVKQDTEINEIIDIILQRHIILVPVIDDKHKLIGLVGRPDILKQNLNQKSVTIKEKRNDDSTRVKCHTYCHRFIFQKNETFCLSFSFFCCRLG